MTVRVRLMSFHQQENILCSLYSKMRQAEKRSVRSNWFSFSEGGTCMWMLEDPTIGSVLICRREEMTGEQGTLSSEGPHKLLVYCCVYLVSKVGFRVTWMMAQPAEL